MGQRHWTLRRTGQLILIATSAALTSEPVEREVRIFHQTGRRIIPVSIDGAVERGRPDARLLRYLPAQVLRINEPREALSSGPSIETVSTIHRSFNLVRQDKNTCVHLVRLLCFLQFYPLASPHRHFLLIATQSRRFATRSALRQSLIFLH
jgi:hypothetical protein